MSSYLVSSLVAGAAAGTAVDLSLFPLDTVKTRLQSAQGFWYAGGFRRIYAGITPVIVGSAPTAALFFCSYEATKRGASKIFGPSQKSEPLGHMLAAMVGEVMACLIRVPVEVTKQRTQASQLSSFEVLRGTMRTEGFRGLYRGYRSTVLREIPFSVIQFPLWEFLKGYVQSRQEQDIFAWQSAVCGSVAGAVAAAATTPLDVAKTRIMLAERQSVQARGDVALVLRDIWSREGWKGLFSGVVPRVTWISVGGFIFLGVYEKLKPCPVIT
ncbi:S-adenosylmethionine mitochondrial carrier protein-like [Paramacrobiotus metropolitanus]|uniref:S-adenosylmethionine mitochondrial carrier protein-like n=1 Tax=Paramacrobiotus metropolitanus TaxID=2943436 RepID=UPI002445E306|nr:S-adenosylmethionine mitochondrial carrier protein-like [Paramacrobiotus metropolitanus]